MIIDNILIMHHGNIIMFLYIISRDRIHYNLYDLN